MQPVLSFSLPSHRVKRWPILPLLFRCLCLSFGGARAVRFFLFSARASAGKNSSSFFRLLPPRKGPRLADFPFSLNNHFFAGYPHRDGIDFSALFCGAHAVLGFFLRLSWSRVPPLSLVYVFPFTRKDLCAASSFSGWREP